MKRTLGPIRAFVTTIVVVCLADPRMAMADVSVWTAARQPALAKRIKRLERADWLMFVHELAKAESDLVDPSDARPSRLIEARALYEAAGGATSPDLRVRVRYAAILRRMAQLQTPQDIAAIKRAADILSTVAKSRTAPAIRAVTWNELAICHAVLGQRDQEIEAYSQSLALEPIGPHRAVLLANRAESWMAMGRLDDAIAGYRESMASLLPIEMHVYGVTSLWGLAVALDRNGDLDGAFARIGLAREYDPVDTKLNSETWFYSPPHDEAWYAALGHWQKARVERDELTRGYLYQMATDAWSRYIAKAPPNDPYVALARVRRSACEQEGDRALDVVRRH